jgi:RimJ/RimL family protein N-acetyltransferase
MPVLEGHGIRLRPHVEEDAEPLALGLNNINVLNNLGHTVPRPYTLEHARDWIAKSKEIPANEVRLTIEADGIAVGGIHLRPVEMWSPHTFEIGYWISETHWGRGIATQAAGLITAYGFEQQKAERMQAYVFGWNDGSRRVLEKNGYSLEGRLRRAVHMDGRFGDIFVYGRLP